MAIADITAGLFGLISVLGALYARERTGRSPGHRHQPAGQPATWLSYIAGNYFAPAKTARSAACTFDHALPAFKTADDRGSSSASARKAVARLLSPHRRRNDADDPIRAMPPTATATPTARPCCRSLKR